MASTVRANDQVRPGKGGDRCLIAKRLILRYPQHAPIGLVTAADLRGPANDGYGLEAQRLLTEAEGLVS